MTKAHRLSNISIMKAGQSDSPETGRGFTRIELLAVLVMLALIAAVTRPVWANVGASQSIACLENVRRLSAAWLLYTDDNAGKFVGNYHGGFVPDATGKESPWVTGWLDWTTSPDNTNTVYLTNPRYAALAMYWGTDATVLKCPADEHVSRPQAVRGWSGRVRSYALNCALGEGNYYTGPINQRILPITRSADFGRLPPHQAFVFLDEHPDSIDDGLFWVPSNEVTMPDVPGALHDGAAWFSFGEGGFGPGNRRVARAVRRRPVAVAHLGQRSLGNQRSQCGRGRVPVRSRHRQDHFD